MDPGLYVAAKEGRVDVLGQYNDQIALQLTPNHNTALHIAALFGQTQCVREIVTMHSSLLCRRNAKGDTALHFAAREGHGEVVKALIESARALDHQDIESGLKTTKEMTRATNDDGDTALHDAVRYTYSDTVEPQADAVRHAYSDRIRALVKLLVEEDPEFAYPANKASETPLYLAAERGYHEVVSEILKACRAPACGGPGARTALHASVICDNEGSTKALLDWNKDLAKEPDMNGWTPLHYAARFGHVHRAKQLLDKDYSIAYLIADKDDKNIALHVAACQGHVEVMKMIISHCPDCWEMVNDKGQNILHVAVENNKTKAIKFILENSSLSSLINQKDVKGNTTLHDVAANELSNFDIVDHPRVDMMAFNKENLTPYDVLAYSAHTPRQGLVMCKFKGVGVFLGMRNVINKDEESFTNKKKAYAEDKSSVTSDVRYPVDTQLIVATLIATVTFAAGFTMPGGYYSNDEGDGKSHAAGTAILIGKAAFKTFVVTDSLALILSTCAIFVYYFAAVKRDIQGDRLKISEETHVYVFRLVVYAAIAMIVAFITGIYAVTAHSSRLAILVCIIGCLPVIIYINHWVAKGMNRKIERE